MRDERELSRYNQLDADGRPLNLRTLLLDLDMTQEEKQLEIWKPIPNYEEYEVSNLGRVKRLAYDKTVCGGGIQHCNERILSPQTRKFGYQAIMLSKNGTVKSFLIHRLVATAFIPNPNNLPQINHKDEIPSNNCVENLEWCTQKYNSNYGTSKNRIAAKLKNGVLSKPVLQYTTDAQFVKEYPSAIEASRVLGLAVSGIVNCCNGNKQYTTCGGFIWKYTNSNKQIIPVPKIIQIQKEDNSVLCVWNNITEASKSLSISRTAITNCISGLSKTAGGYIWKKI